jgi:hypothetical protein
VFGKPSNTPVELSAVAVGLGGFAIDGELEFDQAGAAVAGAGDVNGDGLADVIIGAPLADPNGKEAGRAYVVFGKKSTTRSSSSDVVAGDRRLCDRRPAGPRLRRLQRSTASATSTATASRR